MQNIAWYTSDRTCSKLQSSINVVVGLSWLKQKDQEQTFSLYTNQNYATQNHSQKKGVQTNFKISSVHDEILPYCQSLSSKVLKQTSIHP